MLNKLLVVLAPGVSVAPFASASDGRTRSRASAFASCRIPACRCVIGSATAR